MGQKVSVIGRGVGNGAPCLDGMYCDAVIYIADIARHVRTMRRIGQPFDTPSEGTGGLFLCFVDFIGCGDAEEGENAYGDTEANRRELEEGIDAAGTEGDGGESEHDDFCLHARTFVFESHTHSAEQSEPYHGTAHGCEQPLLEIFLSHGPEPPCEETGEDGGYDCVYYT